MTDYTTVNLPDGRQARFPASMSREDIQGVLQKQFGKPKPQADMSFKGRLKDNFIGVDDGVMSAGERIATALNLGGEGLTMGVVGDEAAAAADALVGRGTYDERLAHHRGNEAQFREVNPKLAFAAEVGPALLPGLGTASAISKLGSVVGRSGAAATAGAGAGGLYGFMEGEGDVLERRDNAAYSAFAGALLGGVAPRALDTVANLPKGVARLFQRSAQRPDVPTLKAAKTAAYKAVDDSGESFAPEDMKFLSERVQQSFAENNYVEGVDTALDATLRILDDRATKPTTLSQLDGIRQNLWKRYSKASDQPQILDAIREIDTLIDTRGGASELMGVARATNARYAKSQLLEDAFQKAADETASTGSGGNIANKYKQAVKKIIHSKQQSRFFSTDEIDAMRALVHMDDNGMQKVRRLVCKLSPSGNGLMLTLHTIAGVSTGGATVPLMMAGHMAKGSADKAVIKAADELKDYLAGMPKRQMIEVNAAPAAIGSAPAAENAQSGVRNMLTQGR